MTDCFLGLSLTLIITSTGVKAVPIAVAIDCKRGASVTQPQAHSSASSVPLAVVGLNQAKQ